MTTETTGSRPAPSPPAADPELALDERMQALEDAADAAMLAPSVHGSQPWTLVLHRDRLELRADRSRQLTVLDPAGRELVQSLGAALFNARVALAARGWAADVDRFPNPADRDLTAVVRPVPGAPEPHLARLSDAVHRRHTHRAGFLAEEVPEELLDHLSRAVAAEDTELTAVSSPTERRLLAHLTREADSVQQDDEAHSAELCRWRAEPATGASAPARAPDGRRTVDSDSGADRTFLLLATRADEPLAWLRSGEALERVLLELAQLGWAASPMTQALEVPLTRAHIRSAITWEAHPQMLLRIGFPDAHPGSSRRDRQDVVRNSSRPDTVPTPDDGRTARLGLRRRPGSEPVALRPVSDGRGGTTWT